MNRILCIVELLETLDLSNCDSLSSLSLTVYLIGEEDKILWSWVSTLDILSRAPPSLTYLGLWMKSSGSYAPRSEFPEICWEAFDQVLECLSGLECFEVLYVGEQWFGEFEEVVGGCLPLMSRRGVLRFSRC